MRRLRCGEQREEGAVQCRSKDPVLTALGRRPLLSGLPPLPLHLTHFSSSFIVWGVHFKGPQHEARLWIEWQFWIGWRLWIRWHLLSGKREAISGCHRQLQSETKCWASPRTQLSFLNLRTMDSFLNVF